MTTRTLTKMRRDDGTTRGLVIVDADGDALVVADAGPTGYWSLAINGGAVMLNAEEMQEIVNYHAEATGQF
jgi:aromatic ring-opening dioxygenase LigB subunit